MHISQLAELSFNEQPVWTSLPRLSWRQKLALRWPYTLERGANNRGEGFTLLVIVVFLGGFILRGLTPTGLNDTLYNFLLLGWLVLSVGLPLLVHNVAQATLLQMQESSSFRFADMQRDAPSYDLAELYATYVERDSEAAWTPLEQAYVNEWLEERWEADRQFLNGPSTNQPYSMTALRRYEMAQECMASFVAPHLPYPAGFEEACGRLLVRKRRAYVTALRDEVSLRRKEIAALRRQADELEMELDVFVSTSPPLSFHGRLSRY